MRILVVGTLTAVSNFLFVCRGAVLFGVNSFNLREALVAERAGVLAFGPLFDAGEAKNVSTAIHLGHVIFVHGFLANDAIAAFVFGVGWRKGR